MWRRFTSNQSEITHCYSGAVPEQKKKKKKKFAGMSGAF